MFMRAALAAGCGLVLATPAIAQSAGYDAVFGGGGAPAQTGGGYSQVFGDRGPSNQGRSTWNSNYVSPLFGETVAEPTTTSTGWLWRAPRLGPAPELRPVGSDEFVDSLHGVTSPGSWDFMSNIGVRAGVNGNAVFVDTLSRGVGYDARGAGAYLSKLAGREFQDSPDRWLKEAAGKKPKDPDLAAYANDPYAYLYPRTGAAGSGERAPYKSFASVDPDPTDAAGVAVPAAYTAYDELFGPGRYNATPRPTDYTDPLNQAAGAGAVPGRAGTTAYAPSAPAAYPPAASAAYAPNAAAAAYKPAPVTAYAPASASALSELASPLSGAKASPPGFASEASPAEDLLKTGGAAAFADPLGDYRSKY